MPRTMVPYQCTPQPRVYHVQEFVYRVLGREVWSRYFLEISLTSGSFSSMQVEYQALLPPGWAVTQCQELNSRWGSPDGHLYRNDWGYTTYVGPQALIEELAAAEQTRQEAAAAVNRLRGERGWWSDITDRDPGHNTLVGKILVPTRVYQLEPAT